MDSYPRALVELGQRARNLRLLRNLQQREVATRGGVTVGTVQRFERTGRASTDSLVRIVSVLRADEGIDRLFEAPKYRSLDEALARPAALKRQRIRKSK